MVYEPPYRPTEPTTYGKHRLVLCLLLPVLLVGACKKTEVVDSYPQSYTGIGIELTMSAIGVPVVSKVHPNGPAETGGILPGDQIVVVDDRPTKGRTFGDIVMQLRGPPNSQLNLKIERSNGRIIWVVLQRATMHKGAQHQYEGSGQESADPSPSK